MALQEEPSVSGRPPTRDKPGVPTAAATAQPGRYRLACSVPNSDPPEALARLTRREFEIAQAVALGLSNKEIASRLSIGLQTVKDHVSTIFAKLQLDSRVQLAVLVVRETPAAGVTPVGQTRKAGTVPR